MKITKNERIYDLEQKMLVMQTQIKSLIECSHSHTRRLIALEPNNPFHGKFHNFKSQTIERKAELTGNDLCRAMLARGDKWVLCLVANNPKNIDLDQEPDVVISHDEDGFYVRDSYYHCAMPVNINGEPLTAKDVGL